MAPERLSLDNARRRLEDALAKRTKLHVDPRCNAIRLVHGAADQLPGLVIEQFGKALIAQVFEGQTVMTSDTLETLAKQAMEVTGAQAVYRKSFVRDRSSTSQDVENAHRTSTPWLGETTPEEFSIDEYGCKFMIRPFDGFSVGLFLEHRENRRRIAKAASGRRVLNLFAYTCGFSVAAANGGATETVSVDIAGRFLEWGKRNFAANGIDLEGHWFMKSDAFDYLKRAKRQNRTFDLAVIDPPSFSRARRGRATFSLIKDLPRLVKETFAVLSPRAQVLLATNHRQIGWSRLRSAVEAAAHDRQVTLEELPLPSDFTGDDNYARALWVTLE